MPSVFFFLSYSKFGKKNQKMLDLCGFNFAFFRKYYKIQSTQDLRGIHVIQCKNSKYCNTKEFFSNINKIPVKFYGNNDTAEKKKLQLPMN